MEKKKQKFWHQELNLLVLQGLLRYEGIEGMDGIYGEVEPSRHYLKNQGRQLAYKKGKVAGAEVKQAGCSVRDLFMGTGNEVRILLVNMNVYEVLPK